MELLDLDSLLAAENEDERDEHVYTAEPADPLAETGSLRTLDSDDSALEEMIALEVMSPERAEASDDSD
jgi:hypothetical protein